MFRKVIVAALFVAMSIPAYAGSWLSSTPREAHDLKQAKSLCDLKVKLFIQAAGDAGKGISRSEERHRLTIAARGVNGLIPSDIDGIIDDAYSLSPGQASQMASSLPDACMTPFKAGFKASQTPFFLNPEN